jgi:hypothetical protein
VPSPHAKHPYIGRVDRPDKRIAGWVVEVCHEGRRFTRYFSDKQFHGRRRAYTAARQLALALGDRSEFLALVRRLKPRQNSRSGIPGVGYYEGGPGRGPFWLAHWEEDGRKIQKKFSVSVYGEERARELAFKTRQRAVREYVKRLAQLRKHDAPILQALTKGRQQRLNAP